MQQTKRLSLRREITREDLLAFIKKAVAALLVAWLGNGMLNRSVYAYRDIEFLGSVGKVIGLNAHDNLMGMLLLFCVLMLAFSLAKNLSLAAGVASTVLVVLALVSYYTLVFHGAILTYQDVRNIGVAARVLNSYKLELTPDVWRILLRYLALIVACAASAIFRLTRKERQPIMAAIWLALTAYYFVMCYGLGYLVERADPWSWEKYYLQHGFVTGTVEFTLANAGSPIRKPAGYDASELTAYSGMGTEGDGAYPDIIFILNESWYEPDRFAPTDADTDYMANYRALDAVKGYAVVPKAGGGTNNSEYELLTGNSVSLVNITSPFNNLDLAGAHSVVDYLETLGYATMAAHPEEGANYHRVGAWPTLGFDEVFFKEDFTDLEYSGERVRATDSSVFRNFTRFYEQMPADQPRFAYLLTIQNHGAWTFNPNELDTVHVGPDSVWSILRNDANEFLSSVQLTDEFIPELVEYFDACGRDVVVMMVGDHAPSIINSLVSDDPEDVQTIRKRETPYFIWRSRGSGDCPDVEEIDLTCLPVMTLRCAGLPLSPYYQLLDTIGQDTRVFTYVEGESEALHYIGRDDCVHSVDEDDRVSRSVKDYFFMEYNNIGDRNRIESLFLPDK